MVSSVEIRRRDAPGCKIFFCVSRRKELPTSLETYFQWNNLWLSLRLSLWFRLTWRAASIFIRDIGHAIQRVSEFSVITSEGTDHPS